MNCDRVRKELSLLLYGELSFREEEDVHQHLESCEDCCRALEREEALHHAFDGAEVTPPAELLTECRRDLRLGVDKAARRGLLGRLWDWTDQPVSPRFLKPAGALALVFTLGFLAARLIAPGTTQRPSEVKPDAAIQRLLLEAARDSSDPALRLGSVDILGTHTGSPEVKQALLEAVRSDPNSGVRLKAVEGLKPYGGYPEVRSVLSQVLLSDDNLGVRAQAIDILVQNKEMALVGTLQQLMEKEQNDYIRSRCQKALREMNASLATF